MTNLRGAGGFKKCGVREVSKSAGCGRFEKCWVRDVSKKCGVREISKSAGGGISRDTLISICFETGPGGHRYKDISMSKSLHVKMFYLFLPHPR